MGTVTASAGQYVVKQGDTMWGIAHSRNLSLPALLGENRLADPNFIHPGQVINVPDPRHRPLRRPPPLRAARTARRRAPSSPPRPVAVG